MTRIITKNDVRDEYEQMLESEEATRLVPIISDELESARQALRRLEQNAYDAGDLDDYEQYERATYDVSMRIEELEKELDRELKLANR
jgi:5-bromo-4-chloroindolyl phosphate hydrolysis protein